MATCVCGHDWDEHHEGECQVEGCDCWYFEQDEEEFLS